MSGLLSLFRPRSVAIIGASDKNPWTGIVLRSLDTVGFTGPVHLVNHRGTPALGRETALSCVGLGPIDAAFVALPAAALPAGIEDMAAAGVRHGAVVTSGFAEIGGEGAAEQARIFERARALGVTLLGPNSLGFTNFVDRVSLGAIPLKTPMLDRPRVGLVSQSGATSALIYAFAHQQNVSLSYSISMGNEAMIDMADVMSFLVEDETTRAIAVFAETIRSPERFRAAARAAAAARKPVIMFKVGSGELTATVAQAHTGALVGDDRVFQVVCEEFNIVRVKSIEDLVITSDVLAALGPIAVSKGFALVSISGGACEIVADRGEEVRVPFPQFASATRKKLAQVLPDFGAAHNPLDITGAAMRNPEIYSGAIKAISEDPAIGLIGVVCEIPVSAEAQSPMASRQLAETAAGLSASLSPGLLIQQTIKPIGNYAREIIAQHQLPTVTGGLDHAVRALGHLYSWSRKAGDAPSEEPPHAHAGSVRPVNEHALLAHLAAAGVPVIPQTVAHDRDEAVGAARALGGPVVLKISSPDIAHKTEIGGVALNFSGDAQVGEGFDAMMARVRAAKPLARIDGIIVSPMRKGGVELMVGVARDPIWGLVMALGLGGVWVELLKDSRLKLLPVSPAAALEALQSLKAARLLEGYRGAKPADMTRLAEVIALIGRVALGLGEDLAALEINPLRVDGSEIEALDALAVWGAT
jgi:acyl-CoA synthetase (NDP forming)